MHTWHRSLLHAAIPRLIQKWEPKLGVSAHAYYLQRMKTKWGSCNPGSGNIRLNTELVKKPRDLLEYVVVYEMGYHPASMRRGPASSCTGRDRAAGRPAGLGPVNAMQEDRLAHSVNRP